MKLRIKKHSQAEWFVLYILVLPFALSFLMDFLHLPSFIKYTIDLALALLLILITANRISMPNAESKKLLFVVMLFIASTIFGAIINGAFPIYYLWGFRNNIRFFVFFFACILFLKESNLHRYLSMLDALFWVNFIVTLFQFFVLDKKQDHLGGIFGIEKGCNAYTNIFILIVLTKSIVSYVNKKEHLWLCLCKCAAALLIAALAELKIFFLEIAVVVVMATMQERFSVRKLVIILASAIGVMVAIEILVAITPYFAGWFNLKSIIETAASAAGYTMSNDMNRLTAITISWERFLTSWVNKLFGLGLGNCDYSTAFSFLSTPFYLANKDLHYIWFSSAFLILETGAIGLFFYILFFICVWRYTSRRMKRYPEKSIYCKMSQIMSVMSLIMVIYNSALRTEAAYMVFFVLALPFVRNEAGVIETNKQTDIWCDNL